MSRVWWRAGCPRGLCQDELITTAGSEAKIGG